MPVWLECTADPANGIGRIVLVTRPLCVDKVFFGVCLLVAFREQASRLQCCGIESLVAGLQQQQPAGEEHTRGWSASEHRPMPAPMLPDSYS